MAGREVNGPSLARLASFPAAFGAVPPRYPNAPRHVNIPQCPQRGGWCIPRLRIIVPQCAQRGRWCIPFLRTLVEPVTLARLAAPAK